MWAKVRVGAFCGEVIEPTVALTISLSITLVAILAGIFLNNKTAHDLKADLKKDIDRLEGKIDALRQHLDIRTDSIQADLRQFYHLSGKHEGRLDSIEKRLA